MAWEDILPRVSGRRGDPNRPKRVTMAWRGRSERKSAVAIICLGGGVVEDLGWASKQKIRVQIDLETGLLRLAPALGGVVGKTLNGKKGEKLLHMETDLPGVSGDKQPARAVEHTISGGALILTLPAWALSSPAAAVPPAPGPVLVPATAKPAEPVERIRPGPWTPADDEREAEALLRAGRGALFIAEEFGWDLAKAQALALAVRGKAA
jgi:hypothetical protein